MSLTFWNINSPKSQVSCGLNQFAVQDFPLFYCIHCSLHLYKYSIAHCKQGSPQHDATVALLDSGEGCMCSVWCPSNEASGLMSQMWPHQTKEPSSSCVCLPHALLWIPVERYLLFATLLLVVSQPLIGVLTKIIRTVPLSKYFKLYVFTKTQSTKGHVLSLNSVILKKLA